ncbi:MAG: efflux RND transporter periplasmic adaptor subunit [Chitinispirillaceae bacterium]|nr:efflux RND transporter periplasmic adaptor subunit [Chitinispirillaceae bacterium]
MLQSLFTGIACIFILLSLCGRQSSSQWRTVPVEKGDLNVEVTASGTVNPHSLVAVGTQVSGTISRIFVDFNSRVKKGQLIALLDTTFLQAAVADASATLNKAQAQETLTRRNAERTKNLFDKGLAAQADLDQAAADYEAAKAAISSARAQLDRAKINLAYATIRSPITGVVVNRSVDVGQTVAASFNTPTLFTIADDLSKMQVQASIDEADIGQVKIGQQATFTVDAYPDRSFAGMVTQVRLQPTTVQNVVTYTVMIDVDNPDMALMPGMTANITLTVQQAQNVLKVPLAALKFTPPGFQGETGACRSGDRDSAAETAKQRDSANTKNTARKKNRARIFILEGNKPKPVPVKTGLSNAGYTAIEGDIQAGQPVIVGLVSQNSKASSTQQPSPLGGGRQPGMPRRF